MMFIIILISLLIHTATAQDNQYFVRDETTLNYSPIHKDPLRLFCAPIKFTQTGIQYYLRNVYSHPAYARDYLPHSLSDFIQFLIYGKNTQQNRVFILSVIRLFLNKIKASPYLSAYSFCDMLEQLPPLLKDYCDDSHKNYLNDLQKTLKNIFFSFFLSKFNLFKESPDQFFDDIGKEIINAVESKSQQEVECEHLRLTLIRFLENCLQKLIWSPLDQEEVWISVKAISFKLTALMEENIINSEELDDLFKSLLESFCHFLNITGSELAPEVIDMIKEDINSGNLLLFSLEEQEDNIESKTERMRRALLETDAKVQARLQGLITEAIPY